tara:strand:+ start:2460 stop:2867 length:408 start_codon:yes stop_codon:yes gene_type:complete
MIFLTLTGKTLEDNQVHDKMDSLAVPLLPERPTETPVYALVLLATTIVLEVSGTLFLRMTVDNARNYIPAYLLYVTSLFLFSWTLRCIPISVAYTTWCAFGTIGVSVASSVLFHERRWVCILLTIPPVIGMYILP